MALIIMILLLSFLVLIHEAGHFFAAKALGMKVSKFGFGLPIGPTLWSKQVGDVELVVHAFLLGGYVSFPDDEKDSDLPADSMDRFINRPVWQRMIVISAGVIANIITAFIFVLITAFVWGKLPSGQSLVYIGDINAPKEASIWQSGIKKGDRVLKINGSNIQSAYALTLYAQSSKQYDGKIDTEKSKKVLEQILTLNSEITDSDAIIKENTEIKLPEKTDEAPLVIADEVLKGYTLYHDKQIPLTEKQIKLRNQLKNKNTCKSDGTVTASDIAAAISDTQRPLNITVLRNEKEIELKPVYANEKGLIGVMIESKEILTPTKDFKTAITGSGRYLWEQTYMLVYGLWQLFTGKIPVKDMHGIVAITKIGGDVIQTNGFFSGLLLTAIISLDLALVNFLPIPALDGGHFMFLLIEQFRGKPLDEEAINKVSSVFFLLLILLMVLIVFNDVYALIKHKF